MRGRIGLQPVLERGDPIHQGARLSPLGRELSNVVVRPLHVQGLNLVVAVQKRKARLPPGPVGKFGDRQKGCAIQGRVELGGAQAVTGYSKQQSSR